MTAYDIEHVENSYGGLTYAQLDLEEFAAYYEGARRPEHLDPAKGGNAGRHHPVSPVQVIYELMNGDATLLWVTFVNITHSRGNEPYPCPCCGLLTLDEQGMHEICPVCFWEDDGQGDHDADEIRGGPNRGLSLTRGRRNLAAFGASHKRDVGKTRDPLPHEYAIK
ncbi:CPCC family cysteine-rich protein [Nonomuraea sp. NPDC050310]|uniref:CPCC family cysteine-rich protein n=1 Tax=Nonomuraea sp. NPDC050310 TaxID=3154935 RepID=UPI0033D91BF8